ncbi:MAG: hypothetical protein ABL957_15580 [Parvularculaceae bacterium]
MGGLRAANALAMLVLSAMLAASIAAFHLAPAQALTLGSAGASLDPCLCFFTII